MTRKLNMLLLLLGLFVGLPFGWLMLDTSTKTDETKPITITQLRALASSSPGSPPQQARYETIGRRRIVSDLLAAGSGLRPVAFAIRAYELVPSSGRIITIDRGMPRQLAQSHRISDFDPVAQALVEQAAAKASMHLLLSLEPQHSGSSGAAATKDSSRSSQAGSEAKLPYSVANGVVVIPADDIRRGESMVYARLGDGHEILFTGDVAPTNVSWSELRPPARLITTFFTTKNREQTAVWLRTIRSLKAAAPMLQIVPGHDTVLPQVLQHGFVSRVQISSDAGRDKPLARHPSMR